MSLRYRIIFAILACAAVSAALVAAPLLLGSQQLVNEGSHRELQQIEARLESSLQMRVETALSMAQVVAAMPRVQRAVKNQDRKGLHRLFVKNFGDVAEQTGVIQFQFHTPDAHSLLRVHAPDEHGDDLSASRQTVAIANSEQKPISGLERGPDGIGIRGISPVFNSKKHVGSVEFGLRLDNALLDEIMQDSDAVVEMYFLPAEEQSDDFTRITSNYAGEALLSPEELRQQLTASSIMYFSDVEGAAYTSTAFPIADYAGETVALIHLLVPQASYTAISQQVNTRAMLATISALVASAIMAVIFGGRITSKLSTLIQRMGRLADGETDVGFEDFQKEKAEIGEMARRMDVFRRGLIETEEMRKQQEQSQADQELVVSSLAQGLRKIAQGDMDAHISGDYAESYQVLIDDFNLAAAHLSELITDISQTSREVIQNAKQIEASSEMLSRRTVSSAATLEESTAALQQISTAATGSSEGAKHANESGNDAIGKAQAGAKIVANTVQAMTEINNSSEEIARITTLIDDIAFQTNLLALNAGVEAARAGAAGSGFAVVAAEVRALAQRTADAARQISKLIVTSGDRVQQGVALVGDTGDALDEILQAVEEVTDQIRKISELSSEQARGLDEISTSIGQLDQDTQENAHMFEQTKHTTASLLNEGSRLEEMVSRFALPNATDTEQQHAA
ncbi:MAG: methyl-accepting chemotaxis protein [Pelagimonas sp.]|jgi:methyl-accepting chemotaxis protein|nr:methyl-accepting chemotaxis protein [Pelagimonas sp.]